jgi:hypothetical protein
LDEAIAVEAPKRRRSKVPSQEGKSP